jgi:hypothetical protein
MKSRFRATNTESWVSNLACYLKLLKRAEVSDRISKDKLLILNLGNPLKHNAMRSFFLQLLLPETKEFYQ